MKGVTYKKVAVILFVAGLLLFSVSFIGSHIFSTDGQSVETVYYNTSETNVADVSLHPSRLSSFSVNPQWDSIDQECFVEGSSTGYTIHYSPDTYGNCHFVGQSFKNEYDDMTGLKVRIAYVDGEITDPLYVGVSKQLSYDPADWLIAASIPKSAINAGSFYWLGLNFSDNPLDIQADETAYIMAVSMDSMPSNTVDGGYWVLGGSIDNDVYSRGKKYYTNDGSNWDSSSNKDAYFKTYTPQGSGSDEPPVVNIGSSFWVAQQITGLMLLAGGIISYSRYRLV